MPPQTPPSLDEEVVQVAVRVRVFSERERQAGAKLIIRMTRELQGSKTFVTNPDTKEVREFKFDYSFNSHKSDPAVGPFATQDSVFEDLGKPVLANALEGKHVCLFAYGQTGAGKSYSMTGGRSGIIGEEGIIPRTCTELFRVRDAAVADTTNITTHEITTEVIEVYCEQVNDLLLERSKWPPKGFPLRLTRGGFACPDTIKAPCVSFAEVQKNFDRADRNRSIGAHQLNVASSRAHTLFKIEYVKTTLFKDALEEMRKQAIVSQFNLVDLAGSERTEVARTSGQMLEEGKAINLSLSTLGNTIKALTTPGERPNFRESKLTMLLMQSMTTGKVIMIAAISPACICYNETLSTLRFAERIKLVRIKVAKNVTTDAVAEIQKEMECMRQSMQEEIDKLKQATQANPAAIEELRKVMEERSEEERNMRRTLQQELMRLKESAEERQLRIAAFNEKQDKEWEAVGIGRASDSLTVPHLVNLHEDPRLAETLVYPIDKPLVSCGRYNPEDPPVLEFNGLGMVKNHCYFEFEKDGKRLFIVPGPKQVGCFINGKPAAHRVELKHNYRVWLGNNYAFRVVFPGKESDGDSFADEPDGKPGYLLAEAELSKNNKQLTEAESSKISPYLRHMLTDAFRKVEQANLIADDLEISASFAPKIVRNRETRLDDVVVHAELPHGSYLWSWGRFTTRLVSMVELWRSWQHALTCHHNEQGQGDEAEAFEIPRTAAENPFMDEDYQLVGEADVYLASLANMIENPVDVTVLSLTGAQEGRMKINVSPLGKDGSEGPDFTDENDPFVDDPKEILNTTIRFQVQISQLLLDIDLKARGGRPKFRDVFARYKIDRNNPDEPFHETIHDESGGMDIRFGYKRNHSLFVDTLMLKHIMKGCLVLQVWGKVADHSSALSNSLFLSRRPSSVSSARPTSGSFSTGAAVVGNHNNSSTTSYLQQIAAQTSALTSSGSVGPSSALPSGWRKATVYISPDGKAQWEHPTLGLLLTGSDGLASDILQLTSANPPPSIPSGVIHSASQPSARTPPAAGQGRSETVCLSTNTVAETSASSATPVQEKVSALPSSRRRLSAVAFKSPCETCSPDAKAPSAASKKLSPQERRPSSQTASCQTEHVELPSDRGGSAVPSTPLCQENSPLPSNNSRVSTPVWSNLSPVSPNSQEANRLKKSPIFLVRSVSSPPAICSPDRIETQAVIPQSAASKKISPASLPTSRSSSPAIGRSKRQLKSENGDSDRILQAISSQKRRGTPSQLLSSVRMRGGSSTTKRSASATAAIGWK